MVKKIYGVVLLLGLVAFGCHASIVFGGEDPARDGGSAPDLDGGTEPAVPERFVFEGVVVERSGTPLEGVKVALDPAGRTRLEATTDARGAFRIEGPGGPSAFDGVIALEGFRILAFDGFSDAELAELGREPIELRSLEPAEARVLRAFITASGLPRGGRWCVALPELGSRCFGSVGPAAFGLDARRVAEWPDYVNAFAYDADERLVDFVRAEWDRGAESWEATAVFDGRFDEEPEVVERTILLPADPGSPFRTGELDAPLRGTNPPTWLIAAEAETQIITSSIREVLLGETQVTVRLQVFPGADGESLEWWLAPSAVVSESGMPVVYSVRSFRERPPESLALLDVPRMTRARRWDEEVRWTAPSPDVVRYEVQYLVGASLVSASLLTSDTSATLPDLPSGYDRNVSFPVRGADGNVRSIAIRGDVPLSEVWPRNEFEGDADWAVGATRSLSW